MELDTLAPVGSGGRSAEPSAAAAVRRKWTRWWRARRRFSIRLDGELAGGFSRCKSCDLLDLDNRKGKAPGGYQSTLAEARLPFIFMNAVGLQRDVETILHEAGHAFHALATREEDLYAYRSVRRSSFAKSRR